MTDRALERIEMLARLVGARRRGADTNPYVLFVGAGASSDSGAKLFREIFQSIGAADYAEFSTRVAPLSADERHALLAPQIRTADPSPGARLLARMALRGYFSLILTTNFDDLLERALMLEGAAPSDFLVDVHSPETPIRDFGVYLQRPVPQIKIVKLHGDVHRRVFALTDQETLKFGHSVEDSLRRLFAQQDTILVGSRFQDMDLLRCLENSGGTIWFVNPSPPDGHMATVIGARRCDGCVIDGPSALFESFVRKLADGLGMDASAPGKNFKVVSHKFVPVFFGAGAIDTGAPTVRGRWVDHGRIDGKDGSFCVLPFGTGVWHITEEKEFSSLADLAIWRRASYQAVLADGSDLHEATTELVGSASAPVPSVQDVMCRPGYVLSLYELIEPAWSDHDEIATALRLMSCLGALQVEDRPDLGRGEALRLESDLMRERFSSSDIREFGLQGVALGYASWAGVSYHARGNRALPCSDLAEFEVCVQGLWWFFHCAREIGLNSTSSVPPEYRQAVSVAMGLLSSLKSIGPREPIQSRTMREAILATSRLPDLAVDVQGLFRREER